MAIFETVLKSDLKKPVQVKQLSGNLFSGDNQGNKITVEVMDNGSPATLSGGVTGYVIREDNSTVIISSGTLSGNKASIVLPEEAYNVVGRVSIVVKVGTTTVGACTAYVYRTSTDTLVDPTGAIPSLQELLAKISACEQATADANKIANLTVSAEAATGSTPDAVLSETGSPAHKHITFKLVKGDKGDTGDTGATPQLSIGTVTTLQPSQDATVTITGTDEEPVLNFCIPQGASGNETIDDTAGIGDTDLVYSADNVRKELDTKAPVVDVPLTTPASVQSFHDGADGLPMALTLGIEPVQDLHGQENPYPPGGGANILPMPITSGSYANTVTITVNDDLSFYITKTSDSGWTSFQLATGLLLTAGDYVIIESDDGSANASIVVEKASDSSAIKDTRYNSRQTFNLAEDTTVNIRFSRSAVASNVLTKLMLFKGTTQTADDYAPYSNICPISGWTGANVTRTGKNVADASTTTRRAIYRATTRPIEGNNGLYLCGATGNSDETQLPVYSWAYSQTRFSFKAVEDTVISLSAYVVNYTENCNGFVTIGYVNEENVATFTNATQYFNALGRTDIVLQNVTIPKGCTLLLRTSPASKGSTVTLEKFAELRDIQVEINPVTTAYEQVTGTVYPITFPSSAGTVYGGTLTVNKDGSGTLVSERNALNINSNSISWEYVADTNHQFFRGTISGIKRASSATTVANTISSVYQKDSALNVYNHVKDYTIAVAGDRDAIMVYDSRYSDVSTFKTALASEMIVYELATPVTYSLTAPQVKTLLGENNIWADTGNILAVDYPADTKLYVDQQIADKISASQRLMELIVTANREDEMKATKAYSTGELLIVNGTLYKATTSIANGATLTVNTNVTETTVAAELAALA